ncbi:hypothetical protein C8N35_105219 [Breoghania corrubedonensis]|uniref:Uncharacterized protein n=1 Tax=Breoghania corrubedonensis TaxID=665038 RepID=A0A2T5V8X7_9HYPH|nr:hypothetical protein C8N35_105219 [Breoghania corrubedonensis]
MGELFLLLFMEEAAYMPTDTKECDIAALTEIAIFCYVQSSQFGMYGRAITGFGHIRKDGARSAPDGERPASGPEAGLIRIRRDLATCVRNSRPDGMREIKRTGGIAVDQD